MKTLSIFFAFVLLACSPPPQRLHLTAANSQAAGSEDGKEGTVPEPLGEESTGEDVTAEDGKETASPMPSPVSTPQTNPLPAPTPVAGSTPAPSTNASMKAAPVPSMGCNKAPTQDLAKYVRKTAAGMTRVYDLYLPAVYDKTKAHPLIFVGHGCGGDIPFHMEKVTKNDAIIVALRAEESQKTGQPYGRGCFVHDIKIEGPYFDQVLKDVSESSCVDSSRVFMSGFSSGSWLTNLLGCARAGIIRAQGNATGGLPGIPACTGPIAAMLAHDTTDTDNVFAGGEKARDRILKVNACSAATEPYDYDTDPSTPSTCVRYKGCKEGFPVVWCPTTGKGHSDQVPLTTVGMWQFWSQF